MLFVHAIFRLLAVAFTLVVSLFLLGVGLLAMGNADTLRFDVVPLLTGEALALLLIAMGTLGLTALILLFRFAALASWLLLLWNLAVVGILLCAGARPSYQFDGMGHFVNGVYLSLLALASLWGSRLQLRAARSRSHSYRTRAG